MMSSKRLSCFDVKTQSADGAPSPVLRNAREGLDLRKENRMREKIQSLVFREEGGIRHQADPVVLKANVSLFDRQSMKSTPPTYRSSSQ